ncbi:MAG TPA: RHS repeat domain-containing protein, partial [Gemmataceae bacterium]|nr:RHS repeat domain-containing protein [Gemmataceae bacterium]
MRPERGKGQPRTSLVSFEVQQTFWGDGRPKDTIDPISTTRQDVDWTNMKQLTTLAQGAGGARVIARYFNNVGFTTQVEDDLGHDTFYVDDGYHRVDQVKDHNNVVKADYAYNAMGQVTQVADGLNKITLYGYDKLDRRIKTTDPNSNVTQAILDANGQTV